MNIHSFKDWSTLFSFAFGNEKTMVTCKSCEVLLKDLHVSSVLSFKMQTKRIYFNPYIYAKAMKKL